MKSKTHKKREKRVRDFLQQIEWLFSLQNFDKTVTFCETNCEENNAASCTLDEEYQRYFIKIYPCFFDVSRTQQKQYLLHELVHSLTIPSSKISYELLEGKLHTQQSIAFENERLTSRTTEILHRLLEGKMKYAKESYKKYEL